MAGDLSFPALFWKQLAPSSPQRICLCAWFTCCCVHMMYLFVPRLNGICAKKLYTHAHTHAAHLHLTDMFLPGWAWPAQARCGPFLNLLVCRLCRFVLRRKSYVAKGCRAGVDKVSGRGLSRGMPRNVPSSCLMQGSCRRTVGAKRSKVKISSAKQSIAFPRLTNPPKKASQELRFLCRFLCATLNARAKKMKRWKGCPVEPASTEQRMAHTS